jgi:Arc/MetJ-type ribon-helix-helix transcriptional regulator
MARLVSDRVRDALERLDQSIDRLESRISVTIDAGAGTTEEDSANAALAERLDRVIGRIESALAG